MSEQKQPETKSILIQTIIDDEKRKSINYLHEISKMGEKDQVQIQGFNILGEPGESFEKNIHERSERAVDEAMKMISSMAANIKTTIDNMKESTKPDKVEVNFGIEISGESGINTVAVAKCSATSSIGVTVIWETSKNIALTKPSV